MIILLDENRAKRVGANWQKVQSGQQNSLNENELDEMIWTFQAMREVHRALGEWMSVDVNNKRVENLSNIRADRMVPVVDTQEQPK